MKASLLIFLLAALAGCASPSTVSRTTGFGERIRVSDHNADGWVSNDEWLAHGGTEGKIRPVDSEGPPAPRDPLSNLMVKVADVGAEEPMTPVEFRSPAGARLARVEF